MRILIADEQPKVRFALRIALEQQPGGKTIGEAIDANDLMTQARAMCPDLAIIDWGLPGMTMPELVAALHEICAHLRVVVLDSREETRAAAIAIGADAFVCLFDAPDALLAAIALPKPPAETEQPGSERTDGGEVRDAEKPTG